MNIEVLDLVFVAVMGFVLYEMRFQVNIILALWFKLKQIKQLFGIYAKGESKVDEKEVSSYLEYLQQTNFYGAFYIIKEALLASVAFSLLFVEIPMLFKVVYLTGASILFLKFLILTIVINQTKKQKIVLTNIYQLNRK